MLNLIKNFKNHYPEIQGSIIKVPGSKTGGKIEISKFS